MASKPPERELDPEAICTRALSRLIKEMGCVEISPDSPSWHDLCSRDERVGELRVYRGRGPVEKVVCAHFRLETEAMESYMVAIFTRPESPVPHFMLNVVRLASTSHFHVDLLPKRDLGVSLEYVDCCFAPLSAIRAELEMDERFSAAAAPLRQRAFLSPWTALYAHAPDLLEVARGYVDRYFAHWSSLLTARNPYLEADPAVAARDAVHRRLVFSRDLDPVWRTLDSTLGARAVDLLLRHLR